MKKLILSVVCTMLFSQVVSAENLYPMTFFKDDSENWTVSGFSNGESFIAPHLENIGKKSEERFKEVDNSNRPDNEKAAMKAQITQEFNLTKKRWLEHSTEANIILSFLKAGEPLSVAEDKAAAEMRKNKALEIEKEKENAKNSGKSYLYDPEKPESSYNYGSVTDSLSQSNGGSMINNNMFKQFNELDCSYEEVANYMDKTKDKKTKAYSTSPNYSNTFAQTATKSAKTIKGEDEADCQTIFHDVDFERLPDLSISNIVDSLPSFDDFGNLMGDLGNKAGEQLSNLASDLYGVLREGFCERLSSEYVGDLAGDLIEDEYRDITKGSSFEGTRLNKLDKESGQNNFTYKVIKNQSGVSNSNLIKAIDVTREDQRKNQDKVFDDAVEDVLDDLEDDIFG